MRWCMREPALRERERESRLSRLLLRVPPDSNLYSNRLDSAPNKHNMLHLESPIWQLTWWIQKLRLLGLGVPLSLEGLRPQYLPVPYKFVLQHLYSNWSVHFFQLPHLPNRKYYCQFNDSTSAPKAKHNILCFIWTSESRIHGLQTWHIWQLTLRVGNRLQLVDSETDCLRTSDCWPLGLWCDFDIYSSVEYFQIWS